MSSGIGMGAKAGASRSGAGGVVRAWAEGGATATKTSIKIRRADMCPADVGPRNDPVCSEKVRSFSASALLSD